ncbi:uncharacterized protein [Oryza sativa Japonica Group]|jgi:hypothetical protein|nr:uncharacterized protein LOC107278263 [Oryza sativa Japonica Group]KAF2946326.1 hypothetical protein DAI22_02g284400 [Oryza sativa Japonica Group]
MMRPSAGPVFVSSVRLREIFRPPARARASPSARRVDRMDDLAAALARGEGAWTEEQHAAFLDRMELSFVQQELAAVAVSDERRASRRLCRRPAPPPAPAAAGRCGQHQLSLSLDRPLPDSAVESNRAAPSSRPAARGRGTG